MNIRGLRFYILGITISSGLLTTIYASQIEEQPGEGEVQEEAEKKAKQIQLPEEKEVVGEIEEVKEFIPAKDVNKEDNVKKYLVAAAKGNIKTIQNMLKAGEVTVDVRGKISIDDEGVFTIDITPKGHTALYLAAINNHPKVIEYLLLHGAHTFYLPIHIASKEGARTLIERESPFTAAVKKQKLNAVRMLYDYVPMRIILESFSISPKNTPIHNWLNMRIRAQCNRWKKYQ